MSDPWAQAASTYQQQVNPITPDNPMAKYDAMNQDQLLMEHQALQEKLAEIKDDEMSLRKYIVSRAFPNKEEGTNTLELGNGYELKAVVKLNYTLDPDNVAVEAALDRIAMIGNEGSFIAARLVSWSASFLVSEYRTLCENAESGSGTAIAIKKEIDSVLTISEAAPTLNIKEPKKKKK